MNALELPDQKLEVVAPTLISGKRAGIYLGNQLAKPRLVVQGHEVGMIPSLMQPAISVCERLLKPCQGLLLLAQHGMTAGNVVRHIPGIAGSQLESAFKGRYRLAILTGLITGRAEALPSLAEVRIDIDDLLPRDGGLGPLRGARQLPSSAEQGGLILRLRISRLDQGQEKSNCQHCSGACWGGSRRLKAHGFDLQKTDSGSCRSACIATLPDDLLNTFVSGGIHDRYQNLAVLPWSNSGRYGTSATVVRRDCRSRPEPLGW